MVTLGKIIVATCFQKLPNVQNIAQSGHSASLLICILSLFISSRSFLASLLVSFCFASHFLRLSFSLSEASFTFHLFPALFVFAIICISDFAWPLLTLNYWQHFSQEMLKQNCASKCLARCHFTSGLSKGLFSLDASNQDSLGDV